MSGAVLTPERRVVLTALADAIAPAAFGMPEASALGLTLTGGLVDRVLALRPDLAASLPSILDASGPPTDPAAILGGIDHAWLAILMQVVAGAYYMHPVVRKRIGYTGQEALTLGRGEIGGEDLLAAMMERPPRWRGADLGAGKAA